MFRLAKVGFGAESLINIISTNAFGILGRTNVDRIKIPVLLARFMMIIPNVEFFKDININVEYVEAYADIQKHTYYYG